MSNMSYCRFQNTARDLYDCETSLEEMIDGIDTALSREELKAANRLVVSCLSIVQKIADAGNVVSVDLDELNNKRVASILESINTNAARNSDEQDRERE